MSSRRFDGPAANVYRWFPKDSSILPWAVASVDATQIDRELGTLDERLVDEVVRQLGSYIGLERR